MNRFAPPLLLMALIVPGTTAKTWTVEADGSGAVAAIQDAFDRAAAGDTVSLGPGLYTEELSLGLPLILLGRDGRAQTTLTGEQSRRILTVSGGQRAVIQEISFIGGQVGGQESGGAVRVLGTPVTFINCDILSSGAGTGGGVSVETVFSPAPGLASEADTQFLNCRFAQNTAENDGGALSLVGFSTLLQNCTFEDNQGGRGGALFALDTELVVENCELVGNTAAASGGGGYSDGAARVAMAQVLLKNNAANQQGGAWYAGTATTLTLEDTVWDQNQSQAEGGGVHASGAITALRSLWIGNQSSQLGGGVSADVQGSLELSYCTFIQNSAPLGASLATRAPSNGVTHSVFADLALEAVWCDGEELEGACNVRGGSGGGSCLEYTQAGPVLLCAQDPYLFCDIPLVPGCGPVGHLPAPCESPGCGGTPVQRTTWGAIKSRYGTRPGRPR